MLSNAQTVFECS